MSPLSESCFFSPMSMGLCLFWNGMSLTKARAFSVFQDITIFQPQSSWLPLSMAFLPWPPPAMPSLLCVVQAPVLDWGQPWSAAEHLRSTDIRKRSGCAGWHQAQQEPTLCPGSQEIHLNSRRHYALHSQQVKKDYSSTIVSFGVTSPGTYLAVLGSTK